MQKTMKTACLIYLGLAYAVVEASAYQSIDSINDAARTFIRQHTESVHHQSPDIKIGRLDSRLKLSQCAFPLEVTIPPGSRDLGRFTLRVRCDDDRPWSLNLPVTVTIYKEIFVTAEILPRGKILAEDDFRRVKYDVSKLPAGYIDDSGYIAGMELKRRLSGGVPVTTTMLRKPQLVKRGQRISIIAGTERMEVRMPGKALAHGAEGDRIRVMNLRSKKKLEGTVTASGDIRVDI